MAKRQVTQDMVVPGYSGTFPVGPNTASINGVPRSSFTLPGAKPAPKPAPKPVTKPVAKPVPAGVVQMVVPGFSGTFPVSPSTVAINNVPRAQFTMPGAMPLPVVRARPIVPPVVPSPSPVQPMATPPSQPQPVLIQPGARTPLAPPSMPVVGSVIPAVPRPVMPATPQPSRSIESTRPHSSATPQGNYDPAMVPVIPDSGRSRKRTFLQIQPNIAAVEASAPSRVGAPSMPIAGPLAPLPIKPVVQQIKRIPPPVGINNEQPGFAAENIDRTRGEVADYFGADVESSASHAYTTLGDQVGRFYTNVPGGYDRAVESAVAASQANNQGNSMDRTRWSDSPASRANDPIPVNIVSQRNKLGTARGFSIFAGDTGQGTLDRPVTVYAKDGEYNQGTLDHELTHASVGEAGYQVPQDWKAVAHQLAPGKITQDGRPAGEYLLRPTEVDARLAEIKRWHAAKTGRLVDSPEEAKAAWDAWHAENLPANNEDSYMWGGDGPTYKSGAYESVSPKMKTEFQKRMTELVQSIRARNNSPA